MTDALEFRLPVFAVLLVASSVPGVQSLMSGLAPQSKSLKFNILVCSVQYLGSSVSMCWFLIPGIDTRICGVMWFVSTVW